MIIYLSDTVTDLNLITTIEIYLKKNGMIFSGTSPDNHLVEMIELDNHPWYIAAQFHPELKSSPKKPHPLFRDFVKASIG